MKKYCVHVSHHVELAAGDSRELDRPVRRLALGLSGVACTGRVRRGHMLQYGPMARRQTLVQLSDELLALLDERAAKSGRSRSDLIRAAVERDLQADREGAID